MSWLGHRGKPERPADPAVRRANLRRIARLFKPYRLRLGGRPGLILVSAGLGIVTPFLLREVLDVAIPEQRTGLLTALVLGMIAIAVVTGVLGVWQTYLSNQVGQRVMHDLRSAVYRHLQRLSLAFFTRTRTGEVQSRIANDIGGVQTVVTSTATSIVSNVTTVLAAVIAMFLLDWRLAVFGLALVPLFVVLTRRVGNERKRITTTKQETMADISSLVQESLSVSGILLGKTMGRGGELADRFESESARLADLEVRQRMAGRWVMAIIQMTFAIMPALVYWFAGSPWSGGAISIGTLVAFTTVQTRLFFPIGQLLSVQIDVQTSLALFDRVFEYLDLPVDIDRAGRREDPAPRDAPSERSSSTTCRFGTARRVDPRRRLLRGRTRNANRDRRRDRLRQDDPRLPRRAALRRRARLGRDRRRRRARPHLRVARRSRRRRFAGDVPVPRVRAREPPLRVPGRDRRARSRMRRALPRSTM